MSLIGLMKLSLLAILLACLVCELSYQLPLTKRLSIELDA